MPTLVPWSECSTSSFSPPKILKSGARSMQRKDPNARERNQPSHRVLETSVCLPSLQTDYSLLTFTLWSMLCHLLTTITNVSLLSAVIVSKSWCMWWTFRALNFWKDLCFLEADSMPRNCPKDPKQGRKDVPACMEHWPCLPSLSLRSFLHFPFQLGHLLWEPAGGQAARRTSVLLCMVNVFTLPVSVWWHEKRPNMHPYLERSLPQQNTRKEQTEASWGRGGVLPSVWLK